MVRVLSELISLGFFQLSFGLEFFEPLFLLTLVHFCVLFEGFGDLSQSLMDGRGEIHLSVYQFWIGPVAESLGELAQTIVESFVELYMSVV